MLTVHLRINDAETKRPTAARVRISTPEGAHFAPLGRSIEFPVGRNEAVGGLVKLGPELWFHTDGSCEIPLPSGVPLRVQATKGPEFRPLDQTVTLGAGQMALRFALDRWAFPHAEGWVSVDSRCHFLTPHDALLEAAAEGLDVVNLLAVVQRFPSLNGTAYLTVPNLTAFSGQVPALERDGRAVVVNTLNTHPVLGTVGLLNSHRPVFPLTFGGDEPDDWGVCDWCDQCHRKGGLAVWVDAFEPAGEVVGGEALVAAVLGKIDAIEVSPGPRKVPLMPWVYRLWDAGFLVPLVGGTGKDSNRVALGSTRTYVKPAGAPEGDRAEAHPVARAPGPLTAPWVAGVRAGRTVATTGPLIDLDITGSNVTAQARSISRFDGLEVVANGRVIAEVGVEPDAEGVFFARLTAPLPESGWVAARCRAGVGNFAHTSPVACGEPARDPGAAAALLKLVAQAREWAEQHGRYANPRRREQFLARCGEAVARLGGGA